VRADEALATTVPLFLLLSASAYFAMGGAMRVGQQPRRSGQSLALGARWLLTPEH
jgi:hypothetical protein